MKAKNFMNEEYKANKSTSVDNLNIKKEVEKSLKILGLKTDSKSYYHLKNAIVNELKNSI